jgi:hypothetical protein
MLSLSFASGHIVQNIQINNPQFIAKAEGIIAATVLGDIAYNERDTQVLELIRTQSQGLEQMELRSALDEVKDQSAPAEERKSAWHKLQGFLRRNSDKIQDRGNRIQASDYVPR